MLKPLAVALLLTLAGCATTDQRIAGMAAAQCPNGANDWDSYRDSAGRLHVDAGCD